MRSSPLSIDDGTGPDATGVGIDLLVVGGVDAGKRFTVDGDEAVIGSAPPDGAAVRVCLADPRLRPEELRLHVATEPLLLEQLSDGLEPLRVNGVTSRRAVVAAGDRIEIGGTTIEVHAHSGISLSQMLRPLPLAAPGLRHAAPDAAGACSAPSETRAEARAEARSATVTPLSPSGPTPGPTPAFGVPGCEDEDAYKTQLRMVPALAECARGHLTVVRGGQLVSETRFSLLADVTRIGRSTSAEVHVRDRGVSREHAELRFELGALVLVQRSPSNFTYVNGARITDRARLENGDRVQIADALMLEVGGLAGGADGPTDSAHAGSAHAGSARAAPAFGDLGRAMEERLRLEEKIEEEFLRRGSMLDVDIVGSSEMKSPETPAAHIILSFERFRDYVANIVTEFGGAVLNSNGDELMCFFEDTSAAVHAGSAMLSRLAEFNGSRNLLSRPFRFRIGVHTGSCLVDLVNGRAFSPLVDLAGHLQKHAGVDELVISQDTLDALVDRQPFELAGRLERHDLAFYRLVVPLGDVEKQR